MNNQPSAGIECDSNSLPATHLSVVDVSIGSPASQNIVDGIKFTASSGADVNDQGFFDNVVITNFTHAAYSFLHPSAMLHTIIGGIVENGPMGIFSQGGSFKVMGTTFTVNDVDFDLENSSDASIPNYQRAIVVANVASEGNAALLRTGTTPVMVTMTGIDDKGSAYNIPVINFANPGSLTINNSFFFYLGANVEFDFTGGPLQTINLSNNFFGLNNVTLSGGSVVSQGNCWQAPVTLSNSGNAKIVSKDECYQLAGKGH
jgi:hypothetical protein